MKKLILMLLLCVGLTAVAVASPTISVAEPVYDFGSVYAGIAVAKTFVIENTGDAVLEVTGIRASCGCTTTGRNAPFFINPGESTSLDVLINTTGFQGTISKQINVMSTDPATPTLTLRVTGQVMPTEDYHMSTSDAYYLFYLLVDLRSVEAYEAHHFLGAVDVPVDGLAEFVADLLKSTMIILYDAAFESSDAAALALREDGFYSSFALVGGFDEWVHQYGLKYVTNPDVDYPLPERVSYAYEPGQPAPTRHLPASGLDGLFYLYVDVRTAAEYDSGHILGAINIPYEDLATQADQLPSNVILITYDQTGTLGDEAALWLITNDFGNARSMFGGLDEWITQYGTSYLSPDTTE